MRGWSTAVSTPASEVAAGAGADAHRVSAGTQADTQPVPEAPTRRRERAADIPAPVIRQLGRVEYEPTWRSMQRFTDERDAATPDEIWFLEHPPVFTLGMAASAAHVLAPGDIPVVQIDRGGQVTYHGPGQLVVYPLVNLRRANLGLRDLVT